MTREYYLVVVIARIGGECFADYRFSVEINKGSRSTSGATTEPVEDVVDLSDKMNGEVAPGSRMIYT